MFAAMDIPRPDLAVKRKKRNLQIGIGAAVVLLSATWGLSQLKPAAPTVDRGTLFLDKVKKGGVGTWGQVPMPPNSSVPDADIKTLVKWVLSLK